MPSLSENQSSLQRFYMFTGEPGTRKSTQALSFPKPIYWVNFDQKINSLLLPARNWNTDLKSVDYDDYADFNKALEKLKNLQLNCKYKTIVVDSITTMADAINMQTLKLKSGTTNASGGEKGMRIAGIAVNSLEDYKAENSAFQQTVAILNDIRTYHKANIILIAHLQGQHDINNKSSRMIVTGGKAISAKLPAYCEEIYYFHTEQSLDASKPVEYACSTVHTGNDFARTTLPIEPKIKFGDKPLYDGWILPALNKLNGDMK